VVTINRRDFHKGAASGAAGSALTGVVLVGGVHADARANPTTTSESYPFHGAHQAGVLTPSGRHADLTDPRRFDIVTRTTASTFIDLMRNLIDRAAS
jgi:deferrochelatase/peroxidase EfeB